MKRFPALVCAALCAVLLGCTTAVPSGESVSAAASSPAPLTPEEIRAEYGYETNYNLEFYLTWLGEDSVFWFICPEGSGDWYPIQPYGKYELYGNAMPLEFGLYCENGAAHGLPGQSLYSVRVGYPYAYETGCKWQLRAVDPTAVGRVRSYGGLTLNGADTLVDVGQLDLDNPEAGTVRLSVFARCDDCRDDSAATLQEISALRTAAVTGETGEANWQAYLWREDASPLGAVFVAVEGTDFWYPVWFSEVACYRHGEGQAANYDAVSVMRCAFHYPFPFDGEDTWVLREVTPYLDDGASELPYCRDLTGLALSGGTALVHTWIDADTLQHCQSVTEYEACPQCGKSPEELNSLAAGVSK